MDRRERGADPLAALRVALEGAIAGVWTSGIGIIRSFDAEKQTATIQPAIRARILGPDDVYRWEQLPVLLDCPVYFPTGGGVTLTFPVEAGDECLVVFADRCIDLWWQAGGIQNQAEIRMHDLSDGCAFVGFASRPRVASGISTLSAALRTNEGTTKVEVTKAGVVNVVGGTALNLQCGAASFGLTPSGGISLVAPAGFIINGANYLDHRHAGVVPGGGNSAGVVTP